jgi:CheY-like chemotaxis protein
MGRAAACTVFGARVAANSRHAMARGSGGLADKQDLAPERRQDGCDVRVLIVDDDQGIRETMGLILREEGYDPYEAADGAEALEKMQGIPDSLVVLLDMWMPVMDGETALLAAFAHDALWSRTCFIVVTANPQMISPPVRELIALHQIPLLVKPFDIDELVDMVHQRAQQFGGVPVVQRARRSGSLG